ncbi:MAG TPA: winged helix-turn-helix domain-containing protein [Thermoanaerobaculia bacterium]|nr:winged helix-turn-helix domain-containing protein [Thermoanaerobaculia bacterium]
MEPASVATQMVRVGKFELDPQSGELRSNGLKTRLADQPLQILLFLLEHPDQVVTREDLHQRLWPADTFVDFDMGLNRAMKKLRDALGDSADHPTYIETLPRRGYRLIAPVNESTTEIAPSPIRRRHKLMWIGAAAALFVLAIIGGARFRDPAPSPIRSIAVLPLVNLSSDRGQEYFADGMTEALITELAQLRDIRVISRTSVMPYKASKKSLPEIARDLNVDGIVEGGVLRSSGRVRVTAQLIHAATDHHLWARSYERDESNIVTLQRDLAAAITDALRGELTPQARARIRTASPINPQAYELFLRGMSAAGRENTQGFTDAIACFEKAVEKQPDFAVAYVAMARSYSQLTWNGAVAPRDFMSRAKTAVVKALSLDPGLAEAHAEMGRILYQYDWDWPRSEQEIRRALELNPNDARAHDAYATLLGLTGRVEEANAEAKRVRVLDPLTKPAAVVGVAGGLQSNKKDDQAITRLRKVLQRDPALPRGHFQLGRALVEAGDLDEGIVELETAVRLTQKNRRFQAAVGWAYALAGREDEARKVLAELTTRSQQEYVSPVAIALVHVGLKETEPALRWLEEAYQQRDFDLVLANKSIAFRSLRTEPRFRELMRRIGLPEAIL